MLAGWDLQPRSTESAAELHILACECGSDVAWRGHGARRRVSARESVGTASAMTVVVPVMSRNLWRIKIWGLSISPNKHRTSRIPSRMTEETPTFPPTSFLLPLPIHDSPTCPLLVATANCSKDGVELFPSALLSPSSPRPGLTATATVPQATSPNHAPAAKVHGTPSLHHAHVRYHWHVDGRRPTSVLHVLRTAVWRRPRGRGRVLCAVHSTPAHGRTRAELWRTCVRAHTTRRRRVYPRGGRCVSICTLVPVWRSAWAGRVFERPRTSLTACVRTEAVGDALMERVRMWIRGAGRVEQLGRGVVRRGPVRA